MNQRQRRLARLRRFRKEATSPRAELNSERRPLPGFDGVYEITRAGNVFSVRLGRFIKHSYYPGFGPSDTGYAYIRITSNGVTAKLTISHSVVDAWLPPEVQDEISLRFAAFATRPTELFSQIHASGLPASTGISTEFLGAMVLRSQRRK